MAVVAFSTVITYISLYIFLGQYFTEQNKEKILESSRRIADFTIFLVGNSNIPPENILNVALNSASRDTGGFVFLYNNKGEILTYSDNVKGADLTKFNFKNFIRETIIDGKYKTQLVNIQGLPYSSLLAVSSPIKYNHETIAATLMIVPIPEIEKLRGEIMMYFYISSLIAFIFAFFLSYVVSKRFTRQLKSIIIAAKGISKGNFDMRVEVVTDDEFGELAKTFNNMAQSLQDLENMRSSFIANVSHELRTPMTSITGFIEGIMDGTIKKEEQEKYLGIVLNESKRLSRLVTELLQLTRLEKGQAELHISSFCINEMLRLSLLKFENRILEKNIEVNVDFEKESQYVLGDKDKIEQVVTNLIDNAVKFTNENGNINISTTHKSNKVIVSIKNTGETIKNEDLPYVFERFYKSDKARSDAHRGLGLGLFIVKTIINLHDENISVQSDDTGTTFTFTLKADKNNEV